MVIQTVPAFVQAVSESRAVNGFIGVAAGGAFAVSITLSGKEGARVDAADQTTLNLVETVVENQILQIRFKSNINIINVGPISVFVDAIRISSLQTEGSSDMRLLSTTQEPKIDLSAMGSGHITLVVQSTTVNCEAQGSSVIDISGACQTASITTHGAATFSGAQLQIDTANVLVQGSGKVEIAVTSAVNGMIQGGGLLRIRGQPREAVQLQGAGQIEHF